MSGYSFYNRDLSWLSFNERVLMEAAHNGVPLMERINFLAIFSSNLDEFYRVRMPVLLAMEQLGKLQSNADVPEHPLLVAQQNIMRQQNLFGQLFTQKVIPELQENGIHLLFNEAIPTNISAQVSEYFLSQVMAFLRRPVCVSEKNFFPKNNELYFLITVVEDGKERTYVLNIPSDELPRFYKTVDGGITYVVFLDDIIRQNLDRVFKHGEVTGCYSFKITRDAELDLKDEYPGDLSDQIEAQLQTRDSGIATRFLHQPGVPLRTLQTVCEQWDINASSLVEGGNYHNLKDLFGFPVSLASKSYEKWPSLHNPVDTEGSIFDQLEKEDVLINTPYQSYNSILRFFNEAALDEQVEEIYITLYRVAKDSRIANALMNAASAGKKVTVLVELKARFDEANNIKWAKKMKAAGVDIIYSITALKVHAKVALVKRRVGDRIRYYGLLSTGNFNENTAAFYTDHILMTANGDILREVELLFIFLAKRQKPSSPDIIPFKHLLVAGFNLQQRFMDMIDREISNAAKGLPAHITIKLNNLEERKLIDKLYQASQVGVKVELIVRSICCLRPGVKGMSENITIKRIVDRYLEHGRVFIFHNNGHPEVYMGSSDWMNRNIYRRIEVCFPVRDERIKAQVIELMNLALRDNVQAVMLSDQIENIDIEATEPAIRSQQAIYRILNAVTISV